MTTINPNLPTPADRPLIVSPDTLRGDGDAAQRTPPGQVLTKKWPVLHFGSVPQIDPATWELRIWGECENPLTLSFDQLRELPQVDVKCDIHCVTRWSRLDNIFTGVQTRTLIEMAKPTANARFVMQHSPGDPGADWTTNVAMDDFTQDDCVITWLHDGQPLSADHGYPVRVVVPQLYFWKGAKWVTGLELRSTDAPGFWEVNGYHMHGDPWTEERFGW